MVIHCRKVESNEYKDRKLQFKKCEICGRILKLLSVIFSPLTCSVNIFIFFHSYFFILKQKLKDILNKLLNVCCFVLGEYVRTKGTEKDAKEWLHFPPFCVTCFGGEASPTIWSLIHLVDFSLNIQNNSGANKPHQFFLYNNMTTAFQISCLGSSDMKPRHYIAGPYTEGGQRGSCPPQRKLNLQFLFYFK